MVFYWNLWQSSYRKKIRSLDINEETHQYFKHVMAVERVFNEIAIDFEKEGGAMRRARQMNDFRDVIDHCGLMDARH